MAHRSEDLRNIALIGHGHSGKTAIVDSLIRLTKSGPRAGAASDAPGGGSAEPEERERKHTLVSHLFRIPVGKVRVNVLDTPGHPDFVADALSSLQAVEVACLVLNAAAPISFHARRLWQRAGEMGLAIDLYRRLDIHNAALQFAEKLTLIGPPLTLSAPPHRTPDNCG